MTLHFTLIGQMGTFLVLWWFVHKYVWPLFAQAVEERRQKIQEGLSMADQAKFSMQAAEANSAEMIEQAKLQAVEILARAQKQADRMVADAKEEAQAASKREFEDAREEIEQEKRKARESLRGEVSALVVAGVSQVLAREVSAKDHQQLLKELSEKL